MVCTKVGDYLLLDTIGEGTFGKVKHAVHAQTGDQFAVKIMDKSNIREHSLTLQVRREISVMMSLHHKNVVKLYQVFTSRTRVYFVMDLVTGGELFDEILRWKQLPEALARFYFLQLIDGLEHCHLRGVFHRDLKPENLLLAANGFLKITDFGLSTLKGNNNQDTLHTQCGTPNYVAPEIIASPEKGYSGAKSDVWSCGIILFVLLAGYLPFDEDDPDMLFAKICNCDLVYPDFFSELVVDLLRHLLDIDSDRRYSTSQVRNHPWCLFPTSGGEVLYAPPPKFAPMDRQTMDQVEFVTDELSTDIPVEGLGSENIKTKTRSEHQTTPHTPRRRRAAQSQMTGGESMIVPPRESISVSPKNTPDPMLGAIDPEPNLSDLIEHIYPHYPQELSQSPGQKSQGSQEKYSPVLRKDYLFSEFQGDDDDNPEGLINTSTREEVLPAGMPFQMGEALHVDPRHLAGNNATESNQTIFCKERSPTRGRRDGREPGRREKSSRVREPSKGEELTTFAPRESEKLRMKADEMERVKIVLSKMHVGTTRSLKAAEKGEKSGFGDGQPDPWGRTASPSFAASGRISSLNIPSTTSSQSKLSADKDDQSSDDDFSRSALVKKSARQRSDTKEKLMRVTPLQLDPITLPSHGKEDRRSPSFESSGSLGYPDDLITRRQSRKAREYQRKPFNRYGEGTEGQPAKRALENIRAGASQVSNGVTSTIREMDTRSGLFRHRIGTNSYNEDDDQYSSPWMNGLGSTGAQSSDGGSVVEDTSRPPRRNPRRRRGVSTAVFRASEAEAMRAGGEQLYGVDSPERLGSALGFMPDLVVRGLTNRPSTRRPPVVQQETGRWTDVDDHADSPSGGNSSGRNSGPPSGVKLADIFRVKNPLHVKRYTQFTTTSSPTDASAQVRLALQEMGATVRERSDRDDVYKIKAEQIYENSFVALAIEVYKLDEVFTSVSMRKSRLNKADQGVFLDYFREVRARFEGEPSVAVANGGAHRER